MADRYRVHYPDEADGHYRLRVAVYNKLYEWRNDDPTTIPTLLARLVGRSAANHFKPASIMTEYELDVCQKLLSAHGYSIYRALLASIEGDSDGVG